MLPDGEPVVGPVVVPVAFVAYNSSHLNSQVGVSNRLTCCMDSAYQINREDNAQNWTAHDFGLKMRL